MGMLLVITGNYLPKSKQNYTVGIKLPWTLNSQDNWNKTHRFAGYLWMAGGAFMILTAFLKVNLAIAIVPVIILIAAAPAIYSFLCLKGRVTDRAATHEQYRERQQADSIMWVSLFILRRALATAYLPYGSIVWMVPSSL